MIVPGRNTTITGGADRPRRRALALIARLPRQGWARHWPLLFLGLSIFILLRADPECWRWDRAPSGPASTAPDVLEHRAYAVLIAVFSIFEWACKRDACASLAPALFFGTVRGGGALLLTTRTRWAREPMRSTRN